MYLRGQQTLGDIASTVKTVANVTGDPYFPELLCRVDQMTAIEDKKAVPSCVKTRPGIPGGVGLRKAIVPVRAYVWMEQRPWSYYVAAALLVGVPFFVGMQFGRSR